MDKQFYTNILLFILFAYLIKNIFFEKYENVESESTETKEEKRKRLLDELFSLQKEYEKKIKEEQNKETKYMLNSQIEEISMKMKEEIDSL